MGSGDVDRRDTHAEVRDETDLCQLSHIPNESFLSCLFRTGNWLFDGDANSIHPNGALQRSSGGFEGQAEYQTSHQNRDRVRDGQNQGLMRNE